MKTYSKEPGIGEKRRAVRCVVCDADDARLHWDCGEYGFVRCRRCGHIYQNPQPDPAALLSRYDDEYRDYEVENDANFLNLMLLGLGDVDFFNRMAARHPEPSLLDIGCATGTLLEYARGRGFAVQGVDVCEPAARYGTEVRGVPIEVGTIDDVDFAGRRFTSVHFSHVIEHVPDPRAFLRRVRHLMTDDALGVVVTPNTAGLQARIFGHRWRSAIADHVHLFSRRNLVRLLRETGFTVLATRTWGGLASDAPAQFVKPLADRLAKRLGFGDVVFLLFSPSRDRPGGRPSRGDHC